MSTPLDGYEHLAQLAYERLGLNLSRGAVASALQRYVDCFGTALTDISADSEAFQNFVAAVTVQHSWLFRDCQQLELACQLLGERTSAGPERELWVPACATGEDVYSLLAICQERGLDAHVLGTDVHAPAIDHCRRARYGEASARHVPPGRLHILEAGPEPRQIAAQLRQRAAFRLHNLLDLPPPSRRGDGKWDLILCRNVLIYFSPEHAVRALGLLRDALAPGGTLILGASDILTELPSGLDAVEVGGRIVFRRSAPGPRASVPGPPAVAPGTTKKTTPATLADPELARPAVPAAAVDEDERSAVQHLLAGIDIHLGGEPLRALGEFRAALYLMPGLWPAHYYLALCLEGLGRQEEARRAYDATCAELEAARATPLVPGHDFSFLRKDVAAIAARRARR